MAYWEGRGNKSGYRRAGGYSAETNFWGGLSLAILLLGEVRGGDLILGVSFGVHNFQSVFSSYFFQNYEQANKSKNWGRGVYFIPAHKPLWNKKTPKIFPGTG